MKDTRDPQTLGNTILEFKERHGCSIIEAANMFPLTGWAGVCPACKGYPDQQHVCMK